MEQLAGTDFTTADGAALDALGDALRDIVTLAAGGPEAETLAAGARALLTDLGRLSAMLGDRSLGDVLDRTAGTAGGTDAGTGAVPSSPAPSGPAVAPSAAAGSTGSGEGTQTAGGGSASAPGTGGVSGSGSGSGGEAGTTPWTDLLTGLAPFLLAAALALFAARAAAVMFGWVRASSWPYPEASVPA